MRNGRQRKDDDEAVADLAELPEDFARARGLQRIDEQQHARDGADDGERADSGCAGSASDIGTNGSLSFI